MAQLIPSHVWCFSHVTTDVDMHLNTPTAICMSILDFRFICPKFAGAGAAKGNLRALNQSVSSQVALLMKNPTKLARRSGVSAEQRPRVLCQPAKPMAQPVSPTGRHSATAGASTSPVGEEEEQDLEAFDDGEFYAQLLKEFLDSSGGAAGSAFHPQVILHSNLSNWGTSHL